MSAFNLFNLSFKDISVEKLFVERSYSRTVLQGRIGLIVGSLLYLFFGILDHWLVPRGEASSFWTIRVLSILVPTSVFALTYTRFFKQHSHAYLACLGLTANAGFLTMLPSIPPENLALFFPSIALTTVATYLLVGNRFIYAFVAEAIVFVGYNVVFLNTHGFIESLFFTQNYFLLSANVIGGAAGYLQERQHRILFLRECELEAERQKHLDRSLRDPLTGLANRELLHDRLAQALARSERDGKAFVCYFIDLDGFKRINDSLGHEIGDKVLQIVAARLSIAVRDADTVARIGGDEFFVLCHQLAGEDAARDQAKRLLNHIETISMPSLPPNALSASIGICIAPFAGANVSKVISKADEAMYRAKKTGGGVYRFSHLQEPATKPSTSPSD